MLGSSPAKKRGCQGASAYQLRERWPKMPNRMGGVMRENVIKCPSQTLSSGSPSQQAQSKVGLMPNNPTPDAPTESLAPSPGGPAGRLQRSPRRRHTKSQNGCPKEARTAQLLRVGEQASAGKGEGGSRKSRRQNRRQDYRPQSCTGSNHRHPLT
ncbi:AP-4 complex subunit sigma-1 isoform X1 [Zalophus californianus]|uniref:AP-4 complex subunit sigma-1 isoform X1 n=1 Tax=Zalophus californianus TaxID=9704 RepID=A0A6J2B6G7_ZALCA|nr:AP-4 complex subunit sigma-1 isoform X1 [Zalophus californianus]